MESSRSAAGDGAVPVLEARRVEKRYAGVAALDGVSLAVAAGECVALVGESGAGKTTLMRCFNRLVEPDAGAVLVEGRPVAQMDPIALRRRTGYVPQEGGLLPHWTVRRNAALVPWLAGMERGEGTALAERALASVGLPPDQFGGRWPRELSGGQRQRVAIARALAGNPPIVLLDEPFGALDAITRAELHELFGALRRERGFTAVLVTHDLHEAALLSDRVVVMRRGRVEQADTPERLRASPATEYVRRLLHRARLA